MAINPYPERPTITHCGRGDHTQDRLLRASPAPCAVTQAQPSTMLRKGVPQPEGLPITSPDRYIPISCRYRSGWTGHDACQWHLGRLGAQKLLPGWLHATYSPYRRAYSFSLDYYHTSPAHDPPEHLSGGVAARSSVCLGWGSRQHPKSLRHHCSCPRCPSSETLPGGADYRGKYVDLGELPPAKVFGKTPSTLTSDMEGKIVLMQAAEYMQSKKHIPDLATWMRCFAIYAAVLLTKYPDRAQSLLMYSAIIARLSKKFRWPSWIIYDQYFRQEAADTGKTDWFKIDSSIHAQCFRGMSLCAEGHLYLYGPHQGNLPLLVG